MRALGTETTSQCTGWGRLTEPPALRTPELEPGGPTRGSRAPDPSSADRTPLAGEGVHAFTHPGLVHSSTSSFTHGRTSLPAHRSVCSLTHGLRPAADPVPASPSSVDFTAFHLPHNVLRWLVGCLHPAPPCPLQANLP